MGNYEQLRSLTKISQKYKLSIFLSNEYHKQLNIHVILIRRFHTQYTQFLERNLWGEFLLRSKVLFRKFNAIFAFYIKVCKR